MPARPVESLVSSLGSLNVPHERTTLEAFGETLPKHVEQPAVGVPFDDFGVSLTGRGSSSTRRQRN
jgi:hypothetical protein